MECYKLKKVASLPKYKKKLSKKCYILKKKKFYEKR